MKLILLALVVSANLIAKPVTEVQCDSVDITIKPTYHVVIKPGAPGTFDVNIEKMHDLEGLVIEQMPRVGVGTVEADRISLALQLAGNETLHAERLENGALRATLTLVTEGTIELDCRP